MDKIKSFKDLLVWQKSMLLVREVYAVAEHLPRKETFCLTEQMRKAAISVPSNIAEGAARTGEKEFAQFLNVARGSLSELETQLLIAGDLGYIKPDDPIFEVVDLVSRLITGLHKSVRP